MKNKKVCIIILNFNGKNLIRNCLESIKNNTLYKNYKVIVVDNASTDSSVEIIRKNFGWIDLVQNKKNYGFSKGNNIGIKYALKKYNPDYFLLLNNDTKVTKNWLTNLVKVAESNKRIGILGCRQLNFKGKPAISAGWILPHKVKYYWGNEIKEVNWVSGACWLIKKEVIKKIGFIDECFTYYEETDFIARARKAGFRIVYVPSSVIYHKGGVTYKKFDDEIVFEMFYKSRIRCFLKNFPFYYLPLRILLDLFKALKSKKIKLLFKAYLEGINSLR